MEKINIFGPIDKGIGYYFMHIHLTFFLFNCIKIIK